MKKNSAQTSVEMTSGYGSMSTETDTENTSCMETDGEDMDRPGISGPLIVKLPMPKKRKSGIKKLNARALSRAHRSVRSLKSEVSELRKKIRAKNKKIQRIMEYKNKNRNDKGTMTPKKQTEKEMIAMNLTPRRKQVVRRKLLTGNVIMAEIKAAKKACGKKRVNCIHRVISGRIAKKYRVLRNISQRTNLSRRTLGNVNNKGVVMTKEKGNSLSRVVE